MLEYVTLIPYCLDRCVDSSQPHDILWASVRQALVNGLVMAAVLFLLFHIQEKYKLERRRAQYTRSIFQELDRIRGLLWPESGIRAILPADNYIVPELQRSTYDGLVSSATISTFSHGLQQQLGIFYDLLQKGHINPIKRSIVTLMDDVRIEMENAEEWWQFWKRRT